MEYNISRNFSKKMKCDIWKRRTSTEKSLLGVIFVFFIVFFIMLGLLVHSHKRSQERLICTTPICKEEAGRILNLMDSSVKPCDNFYDFACGNFMKYSTIHWSQMDFYFELHSYMHYLFKEIMVKPEKDSEPQFVKRLKRYYKSCLNKDPSIKEIFEFFLKATHLGEWSLSTSGKFELEELIPKMLESHSNVLFSIFPIYKNGHFDHIFISQGRPITMWYMFNSMTDEEIQNTKDRYLVLFNYIFPQLKLKERNIENYIDEMIDLEMSLRKIIVEKREGNSSALTLSELQSICPQINWIAYFKNLFANFGHPSNFSESLPIRLYRMDFTNDICKIRAATENRTLNNLIIWTSLVSTLIEVNRNFRELAENIFEFNSEDMKNVFWRPEMGWLKCIYDFNPVFEVAQQNILFNAEKNANEKIKTIQTYVKELLHVADSTFSQSKWMDEVSRNFTKYKIKEIASKIRYPSETKDEQKINLMFDSLNVTDNYLQTYFNAKRNYYIQEFFNESVFQAVENAKRMFPFESLAYFQTKNRMENIFLPLTIIQPPFYAHKAPNYLNYGGIGYYIGYKIFHSFDKLESPFQGRYPRYREIPPPLFWPEEFLDKYKERKQCFVKQYSKFHSEYHLNVDGNFTTENIAEVEGVIVSFRAYEEFLKKNGEESSLPGLDYNNKQMFFIKFAQTQCVEDYVKEARIHDPEKFSVYDPLLNFEEFSKAFNCPSNSFMNPQQKCKLFG